MRVKVRHHNDKQDQGTHSRNLSMEMALVKIESIKVFNDLKLESQSHSGAFTVKSESSFYVFVAYERRLRLFNCENKSFLHVAAKNGLNTGFCLN